ncbi:hypothetical protein [Spirosoma flavum]|uniref:Cytochrome c domain-containing protein n=1 Tax=Spirosoma flavum TaxID=2048557 RepID=A0ABW6AKU8_9BACT
MKKYIPTWLLLLGLGTTATLYSLTLTEYPLRGSTNLSIQARQVRPIDQSLLQQGERLVLMNCAHCHSNEEGRLTGHLIKGVSSSLGRIV